MLSLGAFKGDSWLYIYALYKVYPPCMCCVYMPLIRYTYVCRRVYCEANVKSYKYQMDIIFDPKKKKSDYILTGLGSISLKRKIWKVHAWFSITVCALKVCSRKGYPGLKDIFILLGFTIFNPTQVHKFSQLEFSQQKVLDHLLLSRF